MMCCNLGCVWCCDRFDCVCAYVIVMVMCVVCCDLYCVVVVLVVVCCRVVQLCMMCLYVCLH